MSITFSIQDNAAYCEANNLIETVRYDCQCKHEGGIDPACPECEGTGKVSFDNYPFQMNLANRNARTLWNALGLDFDYCGEIDPTVLLHAINSTESALVVRSGVDRQDRGVRFIDGGISTEQAENYLTRFKVLAEEGIRRGKVIVWG